MSRSKSLLLFSPAKLNLFFRVLRRREDGYHEIASRYQAISLGDLLQFSLAESDLLTCDHPSLSCGPDNLIVKAISLFRKKTGISNHFQVHLTKKIPMEAGLGGGSSNAATTLWALNELTGRPLTEAELIGLGAEFGSDISFFFSSGASKCRGRGELLEPCDPYEVAPFWVAKPEYSLSTPLVYRNLDPPSLSKRDPEEAFRSFSSKTPFYFNDLEQSAFRLCPELISLQRELLSLGFTQAVMTGSGTAFFCFGDLKQPVLPGVRFFHVNFVFRKERSWYEIPLDISKELFSCQERQKSTTTRSSSSPELQDLSDQESSVTLMTRD